MFEVVLRGVRMSSKILAFDTETRLISGGKPFPEIICVSLAWDGGSELCTAFEGIRNIKAHLESGGAIVGANTSFDLGVILAFEPRLTPLIFSSLSNDLVTDIQIRQKLIDIAEDRFRGEIRHGAWVPHQYSLDALSTRLLNKKLDKDTWRLRYAELAHIDIKNWPEGARQYAILDAEQTLAVYNVQEKSKELLRDEYAQQRKFFSLALISAHGLKTDEKAVAEFEKETIARTSELKKILQDAGLVRPDKIKKTGEIEEGTRDTKAAKERMLAVCKEQNLKIRETDSGQVALDSDACERSGDPLLAIYSEYSTIGTVVSKDLPILNAGTLHPIHTRFDLAATGRTTSSKPNVQNIRRFPGIRECFRPRHGYVYFQADYSALELHTLSQVCISWFGESALADAINSGIDPHTNLAARILGVDYNEAVRLKKAGDSTFDNARQTAKVANFGFPGGLGVKAFISFAWAGYGVKIEEEEAARLKRKWFESWPEMGKYFRKISQVGEIEHVFSRRLRKSDSYTALCNSPFQGLASDATGLAAFNISNAQYNDRKSPLFGTRLVNFVHDEFIGECKDDENAAAVAEELGRIMVQSANVYLPDVPAKVEPCLMSFWSKKAKSLYNENGKLIVWRGDK